ncbi:hypothetical protein BSL78_26822 [Apostichopus japonicus]|uniref:Uncharacterized protein n=1 Tax=Stichopus japonicus TaxID=307972 RepID=A0A2G8JKT9_STIJA|nr:hypothetical protein BSL78_26822 [Apostichopus japonicus]
MVTSSQYFLKISMGDNCVKIGEEIVLARNFFVSDGTKFILYEKFCHKEIFFTYPLDSTKLGIFKIKLLSGKLEFEKAAKSVEAPQASWTRHTIRVLSTTGSYARAMILLTRAEETSDLATENEDERPSKRRKLQNRRYVPSSDDTEEEAENFTLPPPIQPLVPLTTPLTSNINPQSQRPNFPHAVVSPISARHSTGSTQSLAGSSRNISPMSTPDLIVNGV